MCFSNHSESFEDAYRCGIANVAPTDDPVQCEVGKAKSHQGCGSFGREAVSVTVRAKPKADFALAMLSTQPLKGDLSDHSLIIRQDNRNAEELAFICEYGLAHPALEVGCSLGVSSGPPV